VQSGAVVEERLWNCTSILALEEIYGRHTRGYASVAEQYHGANLHPLIAQLRIPFIFINTEDDPVIPPALWRPIVETCRSHPLHACILLKHGGHLGFLEGACFSPHSITWLDRFIVQCANAATKADISESNNK